jgi:hypothetical protein
MHTGIWLENLKERDRLEGLGTGGTITLKRILSKQGGTECIEFIWLRIGTRGGFLGRPEWILGFHKTR